MNQVITLNEHAPNAECAIIMPIFNRAHFMKDAFTSLAEQTFKNWVLIIVDDGSSDEPLPTIEELASSIENKVIYIHQSNAGPGAARATGQKYAANEDYIAFFDSDDYWLPSYLEDSINILKNNATIDWVFSPCRRVDYHSKAVISETTFNEDDGTPLSFLNLDVVDLGIAKRFRNNKELAKTNIKQPINAGFQNSVVKRHVSDSVTIPHYRIGEDRQFLLLAISKGFGIAYFDKVGVIYHVHDQNISDTNSTDRNIEKSLWVQNQLVHSYKDLLTKIDDKEIANSIKQQIVNIEFWLIAYNIYWANRDVTKAIKTMIQAIVFHPKQPIKLYKTVFTCLLKAPFILTIYRKENG